MDGKFCRLCLKTIAPAHSSAASPQAQGTMQGMKSMSRMSGMHGMTGMYGDYSMTREASGTSWQPDSTPMPGIMAMRGDWMLMLMGRAEAVYDNQTGPRGHDKTFSPNMVMFMGQHPLGRGTFGFRAMASAEPLTIGMSGYPLLLQTGETADGRTPLIDRQHPHDLLMELAATYSLRISDSTSIYGYFGLPGEPALGPTFFMMRFSGADDPAAPISHHWLDSTHVTFGVATLGIVHKNVKLESSLFTGREPDQYRYDFDHPRFDSYSFRVTYNPNSNWSLQASYGHLRSPEQLDPNVNQDRITASASYNRAWDENNWQTTLAWGRDINHPGHATNAFLLESSVFFRRRHTVFGRAEQVGKDELFEPGAPLAGKVFAVGEVSLGYIYDFHESAHFRTGLGAMAGVALVPAAIKPAYGNDPVSEMLFLRVALK
jgi:hypothetical protein